MAYISIEIAKFQEYMFFQKYICMFFFCICTAVDDSSTDASSNEAGMLEDNIIVTF